MNGIGLLLNRVSIFEITGKSILNQFSQLKQFIILETRPSPR